MTKPSARILKILYVMRTRRTSVWTETEIDGEFSRRYPSELYQVGRPGGLRNLLQRHWAGSAIWAKELDKEGRHYPPVLEHPSRARWQLAPDFELYIPTEFSPAVIDRLEDDIETAILADRSLSDTEREATVKARRGQGLYRKNLMAVERGCRITGVTNPVLLIAGHLKPWSACETYQEHVDGHNGLLCSPTVDKLIDRGLISFTDDGYILFSERVEPSDYMRLGIKAMNVGTFSERQQFYLAYHRHNVFR